MCFSLPRGNTSAGEAIPKAPDGFYPVLYLQFLTEIFNMGIYCSFRTFGHGFQAGLQQLYPAEYLTLMGGKMGENVPLSGGEINLVVVMKHSVLIGIYTDQVILEDIFPDTRGPGPVGGTRGGFIHGPGIEPGLHTPAGAAPS
jgi:hypothetical protein